jgi:hypothetical protein
MESGLSHPQPPQSLAGTTRTGWNLKHLKYSKLERNNEKQCLRGGKREGIGEFSDTLLGKTILFSDREDWTDEQIIKGYRSQHHVEGAFRDLKNTEHLALRPQRHWTDQKIRVHVFCCVLALTLCSLLRRELHKRGIDRSLPAILDDLGQIKEVCLAYASTPGSSPQLQITLTHLTEDQQALYRALDLERYRSP